MSEYPRFFQQIMEREPFPYQAALATSANWPDLLDAPTGMGKTAAVTLAWLWKRGWRSGERLESTDIRTPRRLIWCLPMRVLVEQVYEDAVGWIDQLGVLAGEVEWEVRNGKRHLKSYAPNPAQTGISVHLLMGGESDLKTWAEYPEEDMILIGTQDMLLSRALMRGYGMSRYQWPIHFSLLHNDCLWVFDEVQLMGAGLATSAQLEAFRRDFLLAKSSRSLWVSATLNRDWLTTVDMAPYASSLTSLSIGEADRQQAKKRLDACKSLSRADVALTSKAGNKVGLEVYLDELCQLVLDSHDVAAQTLVIINRVDRAQALFRKLQAERPQRDNLLVHSRFRPAERAVQSRQLRVDGVADRIVVATQAIEAGVDMSSKTLVTELAPWSSLVQRFGRCNRYGEHNTDGARVIWVDIAEDAKVNDILPYEVATLAEARDKLTGLSNVGPAGLPGTTGKRPLSNVLRRRDLLDLFNTDPDLSGFDVDVADYIRDSDTPGVQVFWRDFAGDPNAAGQQVRPRRDELCPVSLSQIVAFKKRNDVTLWYWDTLERQWVVQKRNPRSGLVLLAAAEQGGYDEAIGFDAKLKKSPVPVLALNGQVNEDSFAGDRRSQQSRSVALPDHLAHVADHARDLCEKLDEGEYGESVIRAGRWHDLGKLHWVFQCSMYRCKKDADGKPYPDVKWPLAKSNCPGPMRHARAYFRHELASMLAWLDQHDGELNADLIAYLILAHHGKVRMSLRAIPDEKPDKEGIKRFARGVYEGDELPALDFDGEHSSKITLKLALMEIGLGEQGASWSERVLNLLAKHGPFRLAWWETLVRIADWRASSSEQEGSGYE